jgi:hypothetical protein
MLWKIFIIFHVLSIAVYLLLGAPHLVLKIARSRRMDTEQVSPSLWIYDPSFNAAVTVSLIYLTTSTIHILQAFIYRSFFFCSVLVIGGIWGILGYFLRAASTKHSDSTILYATQLALIVLAPACEFLTSEHQKLRLTMDTRRCSVQLYALRSAPANLLN